MRIIGSRVVRIIDHDIKLGKEENEDRISPLIS